MSGRQRAIRRDLLAGAITLPGIAIPTDTNPDMNLFIAAADCAAIDQRFEVIEAPYLDLPPGKEPAEVQAEYAVLSERHSKAVAWLQATPARTLAGLKAKALVERDRFIMNTDGTPADEDRRLAWSICLDILALVDGAA